MEDHEAVSGAQNTFHSKMMNGGELCRDVVVLKVFRHLCKLTSLPEAEESGTFVNVDYSLSTHAERVTTILVDGSITCQYGLTEVSSLWKNKCIHIILYVTI